MLTTINEGDVVRVTDQPHKVGIVRGWTSTGTHTLVNVKFHGGDLQENFGSRSLDLVQPLKVKASKAQIFGMILLFVLTVAAAGVGVEFLLVRPFDWNQYFDWAVTGTAWLFLWIPIESKFRNRGRTKIKSGHRPAAVAKNPTK